MLPYVLIEEKIIEDESNCIFFSPDKRIIYTQKVNDEMNVIFTLNFLIDDLTLENTKDYILFDFKFQKNYVFNFQDIEKHCYEKYNINKELLISTLKIKANEIYIEERTESKYGQSNSAAI